MKYRCIKDFCGLGLLTVGKIYEVKPIFKHYVTQYQVTNDFGREINLSDKTLPTYFEKV